MKPTCAVFWFKRDLRLVDNAALAAAAASGQPLLLIYLFEPSLLSDPHYSPRHWNFVRQSLSELQEALVPHNTRILIARSEALPFFEELQEHFRLTGLYSHWETGVDRTFQRDLELASYLKSVGIPWREYQQNGVIRGLRDRKAWTAAWHRYMDQPLASISWAEARFLEQGAVADLESYMGAESLEGAEPARFQPGGRKAAIAYLNSFFEYRLVDYNRHISKPEEARRSCSRLSPYLAWGNLSVREVFQKLESYRKEGPWKRQAQAFGSRLRWHCHFIQKFEMEPRMEFEAVNRGFLSLQQEHRPDLVRAWEEGRTGYPLVDAAMRCLRETGYLNFRMRAMVVSFITHHLFQHFTVASHWLARQFLDFEPGIHYGQLQMQAGLTGTNTLRVYNPTRNAQEHDPESEFIRKWVPELAVLTPELAREPWKISPMESGFYSFDYGKDYPQRITDIGQTRNRYINQLYNMRKSPLAQQEARRILHRHTVPGRRIHS